MAADWHYKAPDPSHKAHHFPGNLLPIIEGPLAIDMGTYHRDFVSNIPSSKTALKSANHARVYFDFGLRHMLAYQHEEAAKCFLACLTLAPDCALAHAMVSLCHSPNYNFKGNAYYDSTDHPEEGYFPTEGDRCHQASAINSEKTDNMDDTMSLFPSQQVADKHSRLAVEKVEELKRRNKKNRSSGKRGRRRSSAGGSNRTNTALASPSTSSGQTIIDVEARIISAIRTLTCHPGVDPTLAEETVGRPYADAMRQVHARYPEDAEVAYFFAESLMVMHAWSLYEYPTGRPLSQDIGEIRNVLENALRLHPEHVGLCHLYVHLCEMSSNPSQALPACEALRTKCPGAGHLIHMPTHIDVLLGDYDSCVRWNYAAIVADRKVQESCPDTAGTVSFYFGYIVHNYHMLVYGAMLGGMEEKAMEIAENLNGYLNEELFLENPDLTAYLESYAALDIHVMVRFGRWSEILRLSLPQYPHLMLFRSGTMRYARALAYANLGELELAKAEADLFDKLRSDSSAEHRILHNNTVADLLAVDAPMLRGELAYHEGDYDVAFSLLRKAVALQDGLNYDEPWGKMQPIRHALGGLLLEQGRLKEAEEVFRSDLRFHPRNPWGLIGLIGCLQMKKTGRFEGGKCCSVRQSDESPSLADLSAVTFTVSEDDILVELEQLEAVLEEQRKSEWADFNIVASCACCSGCSVGK